MKPNDFEQKWILWLEEIKNVKNNVEFNNEYQIEDIKIKEFYFDSVKNTKIYANLYYPKNYKGLLLYFHGHMSHINEKWLIDECLELAKNNLAVVSFDMRFQNGKVIDKVNYQYQNYPPTCYSIDDLENSYAKHLDQDAIKLVDVMTDYNIFEEFKNLPVIAYGPSQGGALTLLVCAQTDKIDLGFADIPSDCMIIDRIKNKEGKYAVLNDFINDYPHLENIIYHNESYFDIVNMASKINNKIICSVGTLDNICPPKYFYQAYDLINGEKYLYKYEGYYHGGFNELHNPIKFKYIKEYLDNAKCKNS